jgi:hypothetical protein
MALPARLMALPARLMALPAWPTAMQPTGSVAGHHL